MNAGFTPGPTATAASRNASSDEVALAALARKAAAWQKLGGKPSEDDVLTEALCMAEREIIGLRAALCGSSRRDGMTAVCSPAMALASALFGADEMFANADRIVAAAEKAGVRLSHVVPEGQVTEALLPCDVQVPPATTIRAGCKLSTLIYALELRGMDALSSTKGVGADDTKPATTIPADPAHLPAEPTPLVERTKRNYLAEDCDELDLRARRKAWWNSICREGDPRHRPNLTFEAFAAGYYAALEASHHAELVEALYAVLRPSADRADFERADALLAKIGGDA
jgi:hypothetical protein